MTSGKFKEVDSEVIEIAKLLHNKPFYKKRINAGRIKLLYSTKNKGISRCLTVGSVSKCSELEKNINNSFDYIISINYQVWKLLTREDKTTQFDKLLFGILLVDSNRNFYWNEKTCEEYFKQLNHTLKTCPNF